MFTTSSFYKFGAAGPTLGAQWLHKHKNPDNDFVETADVKLFIVLVSENGEQLVVDGSEALADMLSDTSQLPYSMVRGPCREFANGGDPNYKWIYMVVVPRQVRMLELSHSTSGH